MCKHTYILLYVYYVFEFRTPGGNCATELIHFMDNMPAKVVYVVCCVHICLRCYVCFINSNPRRELRDGVKTWTKCQQQIIWCCDVHIFFRISNARRELHNRVKTFDGQSVGLYCTILYYTILYFIILCYIIIYYTIFYYIVLRIWLYSIVLYYIILYYILHNCTSCSIYSII